MRLSALALVLAVGVSGACGGDDDAADDTSTTTAEGEEAGGDTTTTSISGAANPDEAGDVIRRFLELSSLREYGRVYDEYLHPAQQAVVTKNQYDACQRETDTTGTVEIVDFAVVETYPEEIGIPGTDLTNAESLAVTYRFEVSDGDETVSATTTSHLFDVDGQWRTAMTPEQVTGAQGGTCG